MRQMITLFAAASTQPAQHLLPTRIVEQIVSTHDKQSSRNTSESISSFICYFRADRLAGVHSRLRRRDPRNLDFPYSPSRRTPGPRTGELACSTPLFQIRAVPKYHHSTNPVGDRGVHELEKLPSIPMLAADLVTCAGCPFSSRPPLSCGLRSFAGTMTSRSNPGNERLALIIGVRRSSCPEVR
jgi:hypothetical protein